MNPFWGAAAVAGAVAVAAGFADRRRLRRVDPDRVGWVDWPTVQMAALIALAVTVALATRADG